jgi:hypothetical protein
MKINEKLTFKECLMLLNILHKSVVDYDCDDQEVAYIEVEKRPCKSILNLVYPDGGYNKYMKEYDMDADDYEGIDITGLWGDIISKFNKEIWWSRDKGFYVRRWYHKLSNAIELKKRRIRDEWHYKREIIRLKYRNWRRNIETKRRIKALCKNQK